MVCFLGDDADSSAAEPERRLDLVSRARCTDCAMTQPFSNKANSPLQRRAGGIVRHVYFGWRRVATVVAGGLALSMAYHVVFGQNGLTVYEHKRQETKDLAREQQRLAKENEFFRGHVARLESDPNAIEHQAREELHYTRPGEVIYAMPASPSASGK